MPTSLRERLRNTGIDVIGDVPWGTHFCHFYKGKEDLTEILVPYFTAGLQNNEFCMWVTSEPLNEGEAKAALREAVPDVDRCLESGQLEILPYRDWYTKGGSFRSQQVLAGWVDKLEQALAKGYDGLRLTGNTFWLEETLWKDFADYEEAVNEVIGRYRMMAICSYSLDQCGGSEVIDVIRNHQFTLVRRDDRWQTMESSERRRLGEALVASEERFRRIVETAAEGVWVLDEQGRTAFANSAMREMLGCRADEMLGEPLFTFMDREDCAVARRHMERRRQGIVERYDIKLRRRDGAYRWGIASTTPIFDKEGLYAGALKMITDITERKIMEQRLVEANEQLQTQAEELQVQADELRTTNDALLDVQRALRKSEGHYHGLFERLAEGFAVYEIIRAADGRPCDYRFLDANPAFEEITGLRRDAVLGKTVREVVPALEERWLDAYGDVALTGRNTRFESYSALLEKHFDVIAYRPEQGQIAALFVDVSERKRAEQEREMLSRQKDEFLAITAHELRTPMTSMKGFAQLLTRRAQRLPNGTELVQVLAKIDAQVDRMADLVERLLDVSRIKMGHLELKRQMVDVVLLVNEAVAEARLAADKHTIVADAASPALIGQWDGNRLRQVLANLLSNAVQYSPLGGTIRVRVERRDGEALISVTDEGIGIAEEAQAKLFERYYRGEKATEERPAGMGLGLFISHGILAAHGGHIWVDSRVGQGSTFHVALPLS